MSLPELCREGLERDSPATAGEGGKGNILPPWEEGGQCLLAAEFEFSSQTNDSEAKHTPEAENGIVGCVPGR